MALRKLLFQINTPIPCSKSEYFTTQVDNQNAIDLHVVQGEREFVKDCNSIARFAIKDLPLRPAGMVRVKVTFKVDINSMISVEAVEESSHIKASIKIDPQYDIDMEYIKIIRTKPFIMQKLINCNAFGLVNYTK